MRGVLESVVKALEKFKGCQLCRGQPGSDSRSTPVGSDFSDAS